MKNLIYIQFLLLFIACSEGKQKEELTFKNIEMLPYDKQIVNIGVLSDTLIVLSKGTTIRIYKESFDSIDFNLPITLEAVEFYDLYDLAKYNFPTISDSLILETGGVISLRFYQNEKDINISEKGIMVDFSNSLTNERMSLYDAEFNNDKFQNWKKNNLGQSFFYPTSEKAYYDSLILIMREGNIFNIYSNGFYNLDRELIFQGEKRDVIVKNVPSDIRLFLKLDSYNSLLAGSSNTSTFSDINFRGIPLNESCEIIGYIEVSGKLTEIFYSVNSDVSSIDFKDLIPNGGVSN
jgi:hypothetical protein